MVDLITSLRASKRWKASVDSTGCEMNGEIAQKRWEKSWTNSDGKNQNLPETMGKWFLIRKPETNSPS